MIMITWACRGSFSWAYIIGATKRVETDGWLANFQIQALHWLFGKSTTVIGVNNARYMHCFTHTLRFYIWPNWQRAWQYDAFARREEQRQSLSEVTERRRATHAHEGRPLQKMSRLPWHQYAVPHSIVNSTYEWGCKMWSIHAGLLCDFHGT